MVNFMCIKSSFSCLVSYLYICTVYTYTAQITHNLNGPHVSHACTTHTTQSAHMWDTHVTRTQQTQKMRGNLTCMYTRVRCYTRM